MPAFAGMTAELNFNSSCFFPMALQLERMLVLGHEASAFLQHRAI
jgi:hypothetical protein